MKTNSTNSLNGNGARGRVFSGHRKIAEAKLFQQYGAQIPQHNEPEAYGEKAALDQREADNEALFDGNEERIISLKNKLRGLKRWKPIGTHRAQDAWEVESDQQNLVKKDYGKDSRSSRLIGYITTAFGLTVAGSLAIAKEQTLLDSTVALGAPLVALGAKVTMASLGPNGRKVAFSVLVTLLIASTVSFSVGFVGRYAIVVGLDDFVSTPTQWKAFISAGMLGLEIAIASLAFLRSIELEDTMWKPEANQVYEETLHILSAAKERREELLAERVEIKRAQAVFERRIEEEQDFLGDFEN